MKLPLRSLLLAATIAFVSARPLMAEPVQRDWHAHPAIVQTTAPHVLYDMGDIHGDYDKAVKLLVAAGLLKAIPDEPQNARWAGGDGVFIITGDMIDKGPKCVAVLRLMMALEADAPKTGGQVIPNFGNHEFEYLAAKGHNGKKSVDFENQLKAVGLQSDDVAAGKDSLGIGQWLRNRPVGTKVDDWFFCHAGNTGGMSVPQLETEIEKGIDSAGFATEFILQPNSMLKANLHPVPWWITSLHATPAAATAPASPDHPDDTPAVARLRQYAAALGCHHIVMGHNPGPLTLDLQTNRAQSQPFNYKNLLFLMDTGLSRGVNDGPATLLKITNPLHPTIEVVDDAGKVRPFLPSASSPLARPTP